MRIRFRFGWGFAPDPVTVEKLNAVISPPIKLEPRDGRMQVMGFEIHEGDLVSVLSTGISGSHIQLEGMAEPHPLRDLAEEVRALRATVERMAAPSPPFNERVNVAIPGLGLLAMRYVRVVTNYCTEELQRELDAGWKLLAICPQPDQRRPDYILGSGKLPEE